MKGLFHLADKYIARSNWKTLVALKFCLCAMGVLIGVTIPEKYKKPVVATALTVFLITYVPLMSKFFSIMLEDDSHEIEFTL